MELGIRSVEIPWPNSNFRLQAGWNVQAYRLNARRGLSARLAHVFRTKLEVDHSYLGQESCHLEQLPRRSVGKLGRWWPSFVTDFLLIGRRETTSVSSLLIRSSTDSSGEIISSRNPGIFSLPPTLCNFVSPNIFKTLLFSFKAMFFLFFFLFSRTKIF